MPLVDKTSCEKIQCGATTQLEAGMQAIMNCSSAGYGLVRSCLDPVCVGPLRPQICDPTSIVPLSPNVNLPIPYSPDRTSPIDEMSAPPLHNLPMMGHETKRRRDYYQDQVECPGTATTPFFIGMNHWKHLDSIIDNITVAPDMDLGELAGYLLPALGIGWLGYLYVNGRLFK